ncbi:hypothetical protein BT63DRAFT_477606 [Microthyrium microscopicum]|uniref:Hydrophobin n=1 Tax=Microthyrium microscopicum TaxID=703497 RepID=A0A6A6UFK3_9PEZI|nr:hypothetical protein BT63DRAFT_477606 [Microthyrium microscopicum]
MLKSLLTITVSLVLANCLTTGSVEKTLHIRDSSCATTSSLMCCEAIVSANNGIMQLLLEELGSTTDYGNVLMGLICKPIMAEADEENCSFDVVCCASNPFGGEIAVDCIDYYDGFRGPVSSEQ